jgi:hypothetical protein
MHLNTTKNKRWNGKIDTLKADYLKEVMRQMETYGDRVQFGLIGTGQRPDYLVINSADKKMAFDGSTHLLRSKAEELVGNNISGIFTLDQVKFAIAGEGIRATAATRMSRVVKNSSSAAAVKVNVIDTEKYEYFKNNRQTLPADIREYSEEISTLMQKGMSVEDAFGDILRRYF